MRASVLPLAGGIDRERLLVHVTGRLDAVQAQVHDQLSAVVRHVMPGR